MDETLKVEKVENLSDVKIRVAEDAETVTKPKYGLAAGQIVGTNYQIAERIGSGGMSIVYKARHLLLQRDVALKILMPGRNMDGTAISRFKQEAEAAGRLNHPGIVRVDEFGLDENSNLPYLVMEYAEGECLSALIKRQGRLAPDLVKEIVLRLTDALESAHRAGVVHRDLKPSNIILSGLAGEDYSALRLRIVDFGIAKINEEDGGRGVTKTGEIFGSPDYMSPEQCLGRSLDKRSDIYSLGCVIYEMLTGLPPFRTESPLQTIMLQIGETALDMTKVPASAPLPAIILKCMEKERQNRFGSMADISAVLKEEKLLDSSMMARTRQFWRRHNKSARARLILMAVLLFFSGITYLMLENAGVLWRPPVVSADKQNNAQAWFDAGRQAQEHHHYKDSIPYFEKAAKLYPQFFAAYSRLGFAYSKMGDFKKAIEFQKKVLEIGPTDYVARNDMAYYCENSGDDNGAVKGWEEARAMILKQFPHFAAGNIGRASSKVPLGWSGEQIQENKARKSLAEALTGLERMAYKRGQIDEEEKLCREYLKYFPESKVWREFLDDLLKRKK